MDKFPNCFIGSLLAEQEIHCCGGLESISFQKLEQLKTELSGTIDTDKEYMVFVEADSVGDEGGFEIHLRAKTIVKPNFSKAQLQTLKSVIQIPNLNYYSLKKPPTDALIRRGVLCLSDEGVVRINNNVDHYFS
jgi:hypothetical protein